MSNQLKVAIGLALAGILAGLWGFPHRVRRKWRTPGLPPTWLGLGIYLVEVIITWGDGDKDG